MSGFKTSIPLSHRDSLLSQHRPEAEAKFCFCRICLPLTDVQKEVLEIFSLDDGDKIQAKKLFETFFGQNINVAVIHDF